MHKLTDHLVTCKRCVMDSTDEKISFDENGFCNHCSSYLKGLDIQKDERIKFHMQIEEIKKKESKYNCLIGISGGLDSTFLLIHAVKDLGLKPLAVHVDNGWNTGLASKNISKTLNSLKIDLYTEVLDWEEFRLMQLAMLESGTPDLEAPTDLFINYSMRKIAKKFNIKFILTGTNLQTEGIMGANWSYGQRDPIYLKGIFKKFIKKNPKALPFQSLISSFFEQLNNRISIIRPLRFIDYSQKSAVERCKKVVDWAEYPRKHGESFITRFYQNYFLPQRFNYDKRKAHYSSLIMNGDITRNEAIEKLTTEHIASRDVEADILYFCIKLKISTEYFEELMKRPKKYHFDYKSFKNTSFYNLGIFLKKIIGTNNFLYRLIRNLIIY